MQKRIAFFGIEAWEKDWLVKNLGGFKLSFFPKPLNEDTIPSERDFSVISISDTMELSHKLLEVFPHLELVAVRGRRSRNIDLAACRKQRVSVTRIPSQAAHSVAEFTFALLLALARKINSAVECGANDAKSTDGLRGTELFAKTLGVVGTGHVGVNVIRIARGFGMRVLAWNPKPNGQLSHEVGFAYVSEDALFSGSDIVTLHVPYVPSHESYSTHRIITRNLLERMRRGALLINTAHPELVDPNDLLWALKEGIVGGAAIDGELAPQVKEALRMFSNVLLTPRIAGNTQEAHEDVLRATAENIKAYFRGFPQNMVGSTA